MTETSNEQNNKITMYENDKYKVVYDSKSTPSMQYKVINKDNNAIECEEQVLAKALTHAEEYNLFVKNNLHKKITINPDFESDEEEPDYSFIPSVN